MTRQGFGFDDPREDMSLLRVGNAAGCLKCHPIEKYDLWRTLENGFARLLALSTPWASKIFYQMVDFG